MLAPLHGTHDNFVVLLEELSLHLEFFIDFTPLTKVNELSVIVARLMSVIDIISVHY